MKDTKGVRQELEELLAPNTDDETPEDSIRNYRTLVLHDSEMDGRIDKAEATLQEIMLGMLPEKKDQLSQSTLNDESRCRFYRYGGFNFAVDQMEQNIRGGFKDEN